MNREQHTIGDPAELAALYCSGAMPGEELAAFEAHLRSGCQPCAAAVHSYGATVDALIGEIEPVTPAPELRQKLLDRIAQPHSEPASTGDPQIWKHWNSDPTLGGLFIRRKEDGDWENTGVTGVRVRRLFVDQRRNQITMLVRMDAGADYPRHVHDGPEECLVLEGDLHVGDTVLTAGDYQRADVGSLHAVQRTVRGCTLLIVSSLTDELVW